MTIAIYGKNIDKDYLPSLVCLLKSLSGLGVKLMCEENFALLLTERYKFSPDFHSFFGKGKLLADEVTMLLSVGGDGTFLDSVEYVRGSGIPVLGINCGRLGFLANVPIGEIRQAAEYIVEGNYTVEQREMLRLEVDGKVMSGLDYALNEIGVQKMATSSLLNIHAWVNDVYLTTYWADGLVVATPTGSTAYSMSGGGPIVSPDCKNLILTPICPHNLSMRPLIIPSDSRIALKVESRSGDFVLSADSRMRQMEDSCLLSIQMDEICLNMVNLPGHNYYETLRNKLKWGEDGRNK